MTTLDKTDLSAMGTVQAETEPTDWQPIETAPKGNAYILVYGPEGIDIASWNPFWGNGQWLRMQTAEYDNDGAPIEAPTHWQPLPDPPKE